MEEMARAANRQTCRLVDRESKTDTKADSNRQRETNIDV